MDTTSILPGYYPPTPSTDIPKYGIGDFVFMRASKISKKKIADYQKLYGGALSTETWWSYISTGLIEDAHYAKDRHDDHNYYVVYTKYIGVVQKIIAGSNNESTNYSVNWEFRRGPENLMPGEDLLLHSSYYEPSLIAMKDVTIMTRDQIVEEVSRKDENA